MVVVVVEKDVVILWTFYGIFEVVVVLTMVVVQVVVVVLVLDWVGVV